MKKKNRLLIFTFFLETKKCLVDVAYKLFVWYRSLCSSQFNLSQEAMENGSYPPGCLIIKGIHRYHVYAT